MVDEQIKKQVLEIMRDPQIYLGGVLDYVEKRIKYAFGVACEEEISINDWQPDEDFGKQIGQKTVFLTARLFDLWETAIIKELDKRLKEIGVRAKPNHTPQGDMEIIFPDDFKMIWEIKSSQAQDGWTGATHSSSKTPHYILINYSLDRTKTLQMGDNPNFITELAVFVWDDMEAEWRGKPSDKNSFTGLKIPIEIYKKRPKIVVVGSLEPKKKWCKIISKKLAQKTL